MKSASVQQLPEQWPEILRWIADGEEVAVTQQDKILTLIRRAKPQPRSNQLERRDAEGAEERSGVELIVSPFSAFLSESLRLCVNPSPPVSKALAAYHRAIALANCAVRRLAFARASGDISFANASHTLAAGGAVSVPLPAARLSQA
jgi:antitoxin (DNA-binding transcriptional repressor) of toxin-antitoxin stability system